MDSQTIYEDDAALWVNLFFEKKLSDKVDLHVEFKNRFNNNLNDYGLGYADIGGSFSLNKQVKFQAELGYGKTRNVNGSYSNRYRGNVAIILKKEIGALSVLYRNQLQLRMRDVYTSEYGKIPQYIDRNKLTIKYELNKRFTAYVYEELYLPFDQRKNKGLSRSRSAAGLEFNITKKITIEGFFIYQHELNAFNRTNRDFIYGIGYSHEF